MNLSRHHITFIIAICILGQLAVGQPVEKVVPPYAEPKPDAGAVMLLEDDPGPLIPLLTNQAGGEAGTATREDIDVYSGIHSLRISETQKYNPSLPGWSFSIVEKPQAAGEFRYLRFAWKKVGGTGIMLQMHSTDWCIRYVAGQNSVGWAAKSLSETAPAEWTVVTRDLFLDFGQQTIKGIAFTAMDGNHALFDHVILGKTIADLHKKSDDVLGKKSAVGKIAEDDFRKYWDDLGSDETAKAGSAFNALMHRAEVSVPHLKSKLTAITPVEIKKIEIEATKLIAELGHENFEHRESAMGALEKLGLPAQAFIVAAARTHSSVEVQYRCGELLKKLGINSQSLSSADIRIVRCVRILERAATADARLLLEEIVKGAHGIRASDSAKAALLRIR